MEINWVRAYNRLWKIINGPVYMSGSELLNFVREIDDSLTSYNEYIAIRSRNSLSTSRKDFFWDVIKSLNDENKLDFFNLMIEELNPKNPEGLQNLKALFGNENNIIKKKNIPTIEFPNDVYLDVLNTLNEAYRNAEQKPSVYKEKGEEDLRDYGLVFLQSRYEGAVAEGEAFNKEGKTDILLKSETGENLFVAECKIWHGKGMFHKAVEQLFGYLTWRDTKAALIFFVKNKKFSEVIETIKNEAAKNPYFVEYIGNSNETSFSYKFKHKDDFGREILIEIMAFSYPDE